MKELIKIEKDNDGREVVSARHLYDVLELSERFSKWFNRMLSFGFIEGVDYVPYHMVHFSSGRELQDYALTINTCKHFGMIQRTVIGRKVRQFFIDREKELKRLEKDAKRAPAMDTPFDLIISLAQGMKTQAARIGANETKIQEIEARTITTPDYFTIAGYATLSGISANRKTCANLGRKCARICKVRGLEIDSTPDPRFGKVNMYPKEVIREVFYGHYEKSEFLT